jgi:hypothetical protein
VSSPRLAGCIRRHLPAGTAPDPVSLRESLEGLLTDPRKPRGKRHPLPSLVSVMAAGVASGRGGRRRRREPTASRDGRCSNAAPQAG